MWAMGWMMLGMFLFWGLLTFAAIWLVSLLFRGGTSKPYTDPDQLTPRKVLDLRYSRGEITRAQYDQMKRDLD